MFVTIKSGATGQGTKVETRGGVPVDGLTDVVVRMSVDEINTAQLTLYVAEVEVEAVATVYVRGKEVRRIEYADGTADEFLAG